jgi:hypothetical protein
MRNRLIILTLALWGTLGAGAGRAQSPAAEARDNAALRYWMAFAVMQDLPTDEATTDLLGRVAAGEAAWDEQRLGPILDANRAALDIMRRGSRLPFCDWGLEYELGPATPIAHLARARVLARLAVLEGIRLVDQEQFPQAIDTWVAGVRFSGHIAEGGSLIALLSAQIGLMSTLRALDRGLEEVSVDEQRRQIRETLVDLADTGFDWGEAFQHERAGLEIAVRQLGAAADPAAEYQRRFGALPYDGFSLPEQSDVLEFGRFMTRVSDVFQLPPDAARTRLDELAADLETLHPMFQSTVPGLQRVNEARAEFDETKQALLRRLDSSRAGR